MAGTKYFSMVVVLTLIAVTADAADLRVAASDSRLAEQARSVAYGETLYLSGLSLTASGDMDHLVLKRFQVWADDGRIRVNHGAPDEHFLPAPKTAYFTGHIDGVHGSKALISVSEEGQINGMVNLRGRYWKLGRDRHARNSGLFTMELDPGMSRAAEESFACETEMLPAPGELPKHKAAEHTRTPKAARGTGATYAARIGIETDYEFYQKFGNENDAAQYAADLIAFSSAVYSEEVDTALTIAEISIWNTPADPWEQGSSFCGLLEFGNYWNDNKGDVDRTIAHFMSGKNTGGGVAWVGVLCYGSFNYNASACGMSANDNFGGGYGYTGSLDGNFDIDNPAVVWDVVAVAHEIGHNFDSPHSHCYGGIGGNPEPVDECYNGQGGQSGCYSGLESLPCAEGPGHGCGTIMSYCHLLSGNYGNISFTLGQGHEHGVEPERIPAHMGEHVATMASIYPTCLAPAAVECTAPTVSSQPVNEEACAGGSASFSVSATGDGLSYDWRKNGVSLGAPDSNTLTISNVGSTDLGSYTCVISNSCDSVTSSAATLSLKTQTQIIAQPEAVSACASDQVIFNVTASGSGSLTYQWRRNGVALGAPNSDQLVLNNIQAGDVGEYDVVVTGACGSVTSSVAALTLNADTVVTQQPVGASKCTGTSWTFEVAASGSALTYQWQKNGVNINGATNSTYILNNIVSANAGSYTCVVTGPCGSVSSNSASLVVTPGFSITSQPESTAICSGDDASFSVAVDGSGISYQWHLNGKPVSGATSATYTVNAAGPGNQGNYQCLITATCGSTWSSSATLTVDEAAVIQSQPGNVNTCIGSVAQLSVSASGDGPLFYQWRKDGINLTGETSATLLVPVNGSGDVGQYDCVITNGCGTITSNAATLNIEGELGVEIVTSSGAQGLSPIVLEAFFQCLGEGTNWFWTNENTGEEFGHNQDVVELEILKQTTNFSVTVGSVEGRGGVTKTISILVSGDPAFEDANGDGCNTVEDLHLRAQDWTTRANDVDGDGVVSIFDLLFVSVDFVNPCGAAKVGRR
ncbi:MAG: immunoglobulin domain-containing protein [Acidobacteriota bacterium]|nr:immunoglobulin domain-containing protein [Acidobacteriota bacterium]